MPKKAAKKRANKKRAVSATRRSTAGTGFEFEDYVAAWLLLQCLTGRQLPIDGRALRLQMQTGPLQWDIDDVLFVAQGNGNERRLAVSCKENVQVTANGLPASFGEQAWRLWTKTNSPLNRATDVMALATQGTHPGFQSAWSDIKNIVAGADPIFAVAQIKANAKYNKIFEGLRAAAAQGIPVTDADVLPLIARIEVLPFDFLLAQSKDQREAIAAARSLLASGAQEDAKCLWGDLVGRAYETRLRSGTVDLAALLRSLRTRFSLKDLPDFGPSWARLRALSAETENAIETALPSGMRLERQSDTDTLLTLLGSAAAIVVYGDSGTGKSSQVKAVLDDHFAHVRRVWLAPEHLDVALNEAQRQGFGLAHPLVQVLDATSRSENVLVIDAAERLTPATRHKVKQLVSELIASNGNTSPLGWRVIIVGQTESWANGELQELANALSPPRLEIRPRSTEEVARVLRVSAGFGWLASDDDALLALTNLRTLGWVIQATSVFRDASGAASMSLVTIADKLWGYWTGGKAAIQGLLMRLATRDAAFEHSFGLSELEPADLAAFDQRLQQCPLRLNTNTNRLQFEHDLAADWTRFQQLKEVARDTAKWASYAGNPLWNAALRMLGQFLLRQPSGPRSAWDDAFDTVQAAQGTLPLAEDILLDALFLDPAAATFLEQRAEMLFADNARYLQRLLMRFEHVATVSGVKAGNDGPLRDFGIYLEAKFRAPIVGRWPAMASFLTRHRDRIAEFILPVVSALCERWLTNLPLVTSDRRPVPYRREFAELAHATARARQLSAAKGDIYVGRNNDSIFPAAFAGAQDIPDEVAAWALEMAQRRPMRADLAERLRAHRQERAAEHQRRLESDTAYRERYDRKRDIPYFPSGRRLPPWPLGPQGRVDNDFASAVLRSAAFQRLMRARPAVASEVLLAVLIEDSPEEEFGSRAGYREKLGLAYDHESYPTAFWKSPIFSFLHIDPATALDTLLKLVSFCTDRWIYEFARHRELPLPQLSPRLADGTVRCFRGRYSVFAWSQTNYHVNGQLYSALAALEKWLCGSIDNGADVTTHIDKLLRTSDSVAVLGVLVNVGKRLPELFRTVLKPLLVFGEIYFWDERRVRDSAYSFDGMTWARSGDFVFEMARDWYAAPYRQNNLVQIISELAREDHQLGDFINAAAAQWEIPETDKEKVEFQIRIAQLDYRNYRLHRNEETGQNEVEFLCPVEIRNAIEAFDQSKRRARQILAFPDTCRRFLAGLGTLTDEEATAVAELMNAADGDEEVDLDDEMVRPARIAAAVALLLGAKGWLEENDDARDRAQRIVLATMDEVSLEKDRSRFFYATAPSYLEFLGYYVFYEWFSNPSADNDSALMHVFTSGDDRAVGVIAGMAYDKRAELGDRWWRLQQLAVLWSGLAILKPRVGEKTANLARWLRWARWLLTRKVSGVRATIANIRPLDVAQRVEEHEARQWEERYRRENRRFIRDRSRRMSGGLETHFLEAAFAWLFAETVIPADDAELEQRRLLLSAFWAHQAWRLVGSESESTGDYAPMDQFGYKLLAAMAPIILVTDVGAAASLWQPVFNIGPKGHSSIEYFLSCFFLCLTDTSDVGSFAARWRPMILSIMKGKGWADGPWYYQQRLERHVLGFANPDALVRPTGGQSLPGLMRDLYKAWAEKRLAGDEDNLAGLCNFLSTKAGAPLRLDGLVWVARALRSDVEGRRWYRDRTSTAFMELLTTVLTENAATAIAAPETRQALIDLTSLAVSRQLPAALALQDRLKSLL